MFLYDNYKVTPDIIMSRITLSNVKGIYSHILENIFPRKKNKDI